MIVCPKCPTGYLEFQKPKEFGRGKRLVCNICKHEVNDKIYIDRTLPKFDWNKVMTKSEYATKYGITPASVTYRCDHGMVLLVKTGRYAELIYDL